MKRIQLVTIMLFMMFIFIGSSHGESLNQQVEKIIASGDTAKIQTALNDINKKIDRCQEILNKNNTQEEQCNQYLQLRENLETALHEE